MSDREVKILVIDDDDVVLKSMRKVLKMEGYSVETSSSGKEGLEKIRNEKFDIVFLDLKMPEENGIDVLKEIKSINIEACVIIITGYATIETATTAIRLNAHDYVLKPLEPAQIRAIILKVLKRKEIETRILEKIPAHKVLIVGGEPGEMKEIAEKIIEEKIPVVSIPRISDALAHVAQDSSFTTVLYNMDDTRDMEPLKSFKDLNPEIIFVPLTSRPDVRESIRLLKDGAYDYLIKPINPEEVARLLKEAWHKRNLGFINKQLVYDLQKINDELEHSYEYTANIVRHINDIFIVTDLNYRIKNLGQATCDLLKYQKEDLLDREVWAIMEVSEKEIDDLKSAMQIRNTEKYFISKDGCRIPTLFSSSPIKDPSGKITGLLCVAKDITDLKIAEGQIMASLKEKEVLLREIHHRVKNNMQVISSLLRLQGRMNASKELDEFVKECQNRIKSMALIHEMLYKSDDLVHINMEDYMRELVKTLMRTYGSGRGDIALNIDVRDIQIEIGNAIPFGLVINELVSNALKHAFPERREGAIDISLKRAGSDELEMVVSDNGIGMAENIDIRNTTSLGLQLVTSLVEEQMDGKITLDQKAGTRYIMNFKGL